LRADEHVDSVSSKYRYSASYPVLEPTMAYSSRTFVTLHFACERRRTHKNIKKSAFCSQFFGSNCRR
jgi:hypothetical protein